VECLRPLKRRYAPSRPSVAGDRSPLHRLQAGGDAAFRKCVREVQRKRFDIMTGEEWDALAAAPPPPVPAEVPEELDRALDKFATYLTKGLAAAPPVDLPEELPDAAGALERLEAVFENMMQGFIEAGEPDKTVGVLQFATRCVRDEMCRAGPVPAQAESGEVERLKSWCRDVEGRLDFIRRERDRLHVECSGHMATIRELEGEVAKLKSGREVWFNHAKYLAEERARLTRAAETARDALSRWQHTHGCPDCGGDCASANPPVSCCITIETREALATLSAALGERP
jgi:hypothetical protein